MIAPANPALRAFIAQLGDELLLAQVLIRRAGSGYELRHASDGRLASDALRLTSVSDLRALAQSTAAAAFRPLKSAPNLRAGWRVVAANDLELDVALQHLYPGAIADRFAVQSQPVPVTHYREFTGRQTGMYRVTTMLTDEQGAQVTRACCHRSFCLKQRLWTVGTLAPDAADEKSLVPCLEPCAILLEFARKALRLEQEEKVTVSFSASELETMKAALEIAASAPAGEGREADFNSPANPRRLRLALEKLKPLSPPPRAVEDVP